MRDFDANGVDIYARPWDAYRGGVYDGGIMGRREPAPRRETRMSDLEFARVLAERMHFGQVDKAGAPYIEHLRRVVALLPVNSDEETRIIAWLHDIVEDTSISLATLHALGFSATVVEGVFALTRCHRKGYETYIGEILASGSSRAIVVKLADLRDHLTPACPANLRPRYEAALVLVEAYLLQGRQS